MAADRETALRNLRKAQAVNHKGSHQKFTNLKQAFLQTFHELGGIPYLTKWAKKNPNLYYQLLARLLPREEHHSGEITVTHYVDLSDPQLLEIAKKRQLPLPERILRAMQFN